MDPGPPGPVGSWQGNPACMFRGSSPFITIRAPTSSVGIILPDETTKTGYSVFNAKRMAPQTPIAVSKTMATRKRPLAVSFLRRNLHNLRTWLLNDLPAGSSMLLLERPYLDFILNPLQKLFCGTSPCCQELFAALCNSVYLPAPASLSLPNSLQVPLLLHGME